MWVPSGLPSGGVQDEVATAGHAQSCCAAAGSCNGNFVLAWQDITVGAFNATVPMNKNGLRTFICTVNSEKKQLCGWSLGLPRNGWRHASLVCGAVWCAPFARARRPLPSGHAHQRQHDWVLSACDALPSDVRSRAFADAFPDALRNVQDSPPKKLVAMESLGGVRRRSPRCRGVDGPAVAKAITTPNEMHRTQSPPLLRKNRPRGAAACTLCCRTAMTNPKCLRGGGRVGMLERFAASTRGIGVVSVHRPVKRHTAHSRGARSERPEDETVRRNKQTQKA